ncbi:MAG: hypothetical protein JNL98_25830 [Bryobacterales bacterium]|nr:hypothetical protein [Bryobacterales bacterium]
MSTILNSWKEIAAYLRTSVRTVQRWERSEGLPVRRHSHGNGGTVWANSEDLDQWLSGRSRPAEALPARRRAPALWLILAAILAAATLMFWLAVPSGGAITTLAVLPFATEGSDPNAEYLGEGLAESLTRGLSHMDGLRVKVLAQTAVARLGKPPGDVREAGRLLHVDAILSGRVAQRDDSLTVHVELVRVDDQTLLWSDRFDTRMAEVPNLQDEIARRIAARLHLRLARTGRPPGKAQTTSAEAHRDYLRGRYHWNRRTAGGIDRAIQYFESAIAADPGYALAYAGLAESYAVRSYYKAVAPGESARRSMAAARKAIELDSSISEAWNALAYMKSDYEWQWEIADQHFQRALALDPNNATAHHWFSEHLAALGRFDEEQREIERAADLDPLSLIIANNLGHVWYFRRRMEEAAAIYRKTMDEFPQLPNAHQDLGKVYLAQGRYRDAIREFKRAHSLSGTPLHEGLLGLAHGLAGDTETARGMETSLLRRRRQEYVSPYVMALLAMGLRENSRAVEWLEKAAEERTPTLKWIGVDPMFDSLRGEPRFRAILERMGLPIRIAALPSGPVGMP